MSYQKLRFLIGSLLLSVIIIHTSCHRNIPKREIISFQSVENIDYTEVYRRMTNGLSFNQYGYQLEPQWKLKFISADSARIFSPIKNRFINFPLTRGYDSIFNTARTWYKVRKMNRDSLVLEILRFSGDTIDVTGNKVFMTFYSNHHIYDVLHSDSAILRRPSRADSAFIRKRVAQVNANPDSAFAARQPVKLVSRTKNITIEQRVTPPSILNNFDSSDDYLDPEFTITINKAYADFKYSFTVKVDGQGNMRYGVPLVAFQEENYKQSYLHLSQAVLNTYIKLYVQVTPGSTLGMPHNSTISLHVIGKKG